jgi:hypothetical protein
MSLCQPLTLMTRNKRPVFGFWRDDMTTFVGTLTDAASD